MLHSNSPNMPTTRRQSAIAEGKIEPDEHDEQREHHERKSRRRSSAARKGRPQSTSRMSKAEDDNETATNNETQDPVLGDKREHAEAEGEREEPPQKIPKVENEGDSQSAYKPGTIERGHIYFFYRPRVEHDEAHSIEDIQRFHMVLIPRPPDFLVSESSTISEDVKAEDSENMKVLSPGADAVPAPEPTGSSKKFYRLITVGKKKLPDPEGHASSGGRRKETFWATVVAVGDDLIQLTEGLGAKTYETKTLGTRHNAPARLVARGGYAIVNSDPKTPSKRETHLGYHVSHPGPGEMGDVQQALGIYSASSFIIQVKNPLAPSQGSFQQNSKGADYPDWIMRDVFGASSGGKKHTRGRESYGLRFASCETPELLNYPNAQLLMIAAREGEEGLETSLGGGRGVALTEVELEEGHEAIAKVFDEIGLDLDKFPADSLEGTWI